LKKDLQGSDKKSEEKDRDNEKESEDKPKKSLGEVDKKTLSFASY